MAVLNSLSDLIAIFGRMDEGQRRDTVRAVATQLKPCFAKFCRERGLEKEWIDISSVLLGSNEVSRDQGYAVSQRVIDDLDEQLQDYPLPAFSAVAACCAVFDMDEKRAFSDASGIITHEIGHINMIACGRNDDEAVDVNDKLHRSVVPFVDYYRRYAEGSIKRSELLTLSELYDILTIHENYT